MTKNVIKCPKCKKIFTRGSTVMIDKDKQKIINKQPHSVKFSIKQHEVINMKNEIEVDGIKYVKKDSVQQQKAKSKKGLTYCIIRTYSAGVFAGWINRKQALESLAQSATIYDSRRIHYWKGACSISQMANEGLKKLDECRIAVHVPETDLRRVIEVVPCSQCAKEQIEGANEWKSL